MNKCSRFILFSLAVTATLGTAVYLAFFHIPTTTLRFSESDSVLLNPSRGFYIQFDTSDVQGMEKLRSKGISLVLLTFNIKDSVNSEIPVAKLEELSRALEFVRAQGLKVIFRAAYGFSSEDEYKDPSSLETIKSHILQMSPILKENKDVLLTVQAGFLGPWGEWHHSNLENAKGELEDKVINELIKALLEAVPEPISIAVRRPSFIRKLDPSFVVTERIAFHNDALLAGLTDMNTYDQSDYGREEELAYIEARGLSVANGGEMTNLSEYTKPENALMEFSKLNLTYLNHEYNREVLDMWEQSTYENRNFIDLISNRLGYRWSLKTAKVPSSFAEGQSIVVRLTLSNSGFAAVSLPYGVQLIISDASGIKQILPFENVNLQDLKPQETMDIALTLSPKDLLDEFTLGIRIHEIGDYRDDDRYWVQLANENMQYSEGINSFAMYQWDNQSRYTLEKLVSE